jgi:hypothetical protein
MNIIPIALAQTGTQTGIIGAIDRILPGGINNIFNLGLGIGAIIALGTVTYAGIIYASSGDSSSKQKDAKDWIVAAAKGLALIAGGVIILNIINPNLVQIDDSSIGDSHILGAPGYPDFSGQGGGAGTHTGGGSGSGRPF